MYIDTIHCYDDEERSKMIKKMHENYRKKEILLKDLWFSTMHNYLHGLITQEEYRSAMDDIEYQRQC